ncbi:MAG: type II toxin-antitoxin system RelE/ParE family toxin [Saprospiraceae bacterium]
MAKRVIWGKKAKAIFDERLLFLEYNYGEKVAANFTKDVKKALVSIGNYPDAGREVLQRKGVRFRKIRKHLNIYYKIKNDVIIVFLFDTRQDPKKNPYR